MKVLVTGGTGYLGRAIVQALARRGHDPIVFARRAPAANDLPASAVSGDVRDRATLIKVARGVDAVCHTAAIVSIWQPDPADFDRVNVGGLETVIDVCTARAIPRLVYTSSFLALPPAGRTRPLEANEYQRSKVRAREIARAAAARGVPLIALVPGVIYGPGVATEGNLVARLIRDHLAQRLPGVIGADHIWSFAYVDDVADAHVTALERGEPGEEYLLGGENAPQMRLFERVRELTGAELPRRIPRGAAYVLAVMEELASRRRRRPPRVTRGTVTILNHDWPVDTGRSIQKLNYHVTPLAEGMERVVAAAK